MKKHGWLVGAAFLAGILLANLIGRETLGVYGLSSDYQVADERRLFCYLLLERGKAVFICFLLDRALGTEAFRVIAESIFGVLLGAAVVFAIWNAGIAGILVAVCAGIPHWGCYVLAFWVYLKGKRSGVEILPGVLGVVLTVFGVLLEAYVNPGLMRYVLGKFL